MVQVTTLRGNIESEPVLSLWGFSGSSKTGIKSWESVWDKNKDERRKWQLTGQKAVSTKLKVTQHPAMPLRIYFMIQEFRKCQDGFLRINKLLLNYTNRFILNLLDSHFGSFYFNHNSKLLPNRRHSLCHNAVKLIVPSDFVKKKKAFKLMY